MKLTAVRVTLVGILCVLMFLLGMVVEGFHGNGDVRGAEHLIGLSFTAAERDSMRSGLADQRTSYENIRKVPLANSVVPSLQFDPRPDGFRPPTNTRFVTSPPAHIRRPKDLNDLAFASVGELAELIRTRQVTSVELTRMYLDRLKKYGPKLECVVTLTEDLALKQARRADQDLARGIYRGPLHGIPYGIKDLFAVRGYKTTWGAMPYKDQVIDENATVVQRLEAAGAVLVAKTTLGALAMGDVWFGGKTRNPWKVSQGSSGSSAGSAAATAAGLVGFAIGTETWGSIVSPATRCGATGLRPTYGRVSRAGAMALSWSMDKVGPICRTAEDCALVLRAIYGPDGKDPSVANIPFSYTPAADLKRLRIGYVKSEFDSVREDKANSDAVLATLRSLGATLIPIELPNRYPVQDLSIILNAEAGAAFDDLTRSGRDDLLVRQDKDAWPNLFRLSRFIPAVEYVQANRIRQLLIRDMQSLMDTIDVYVAPPFEGDNLLLTNLTGHPCVVLPDGFSKDGTPTSITLMGRLYDEGTVLAVARLYQNATGFHRKHPDVSRF